MYDSRNEIALMRLIGVSMGRINLLYVIQNGIIGLVSTLLALLSSRLCLIMMSGFVSDMGIVLDFTRLYPFEIAIMAAVFLISVLPTVICTLNMSKKDGLSE
jgi:ABC-type lipoprotein release transport system permease subunit